MFVMTAVLSSRWGVFRVPGRPVFAGGPAGYSRESTPDGGAHYMESYRDVNGKSMFAQLSVTWVSNQHIFLTKSVI